MMVPKTTPVPRAMEHVRQRLERWRGTRAYRRSPIPKTLWAAAVRVAQEHGLYTTARTLRLDYTSLKTRVGAAAAPEGPSPTFIELPPAASAVCECVIELDGPRGGTLRVQIKGAAPDLVALSRVVWMGRRA